MRELRHSSDEEPGFSRIRRGKGWSYYDADGNRIDDPEIIERLNGLAVPPAYEEVWFCRDDKGHVQATGLDDKGRKQYRYHDDFRELAELAKFAELAAFGRRLPRIRKRVARDLRRRKLTRRTVMAAILHLLDEHLLRIGNRQYASSNDSFGATTLRDDHVERLKTRLKLQYRAKHGIERDITVTDASAVRIINGSRDLPGEHLFQYEDDRGAIRKIDSADVNAYLKRVSGADLTAKQFRTWGASAMAMGLMRQAVTNGEKITLKSIVEPVAERLGNTPAVTRSSYIHPDLIEAVKDRPRDPFGRLAFPKKAWKRLSPAEISLIYFLERGDPPPSWQRRLIRRFFGPHG